MKTICFLILLSIVFASCHSNPTNFEGGNLPEHEVAKTLAPPKDQTPSHNPLTGQKVIREGTIEFETKDLKASRRFISDLCKTHRSYIQEEGNRHSEYQLATETIIRIPSDQYDDVVAKVEEHAFRLSQKNIKVVDVTDEFVDVQARLKAKYELERRYLELIKRAKNVEEVLAVEAQLTSVRYEIESMEGRMRSLNDRIAFSTLSLSFFQVLVQPTTNPPGYASKLLVALQSGWEILLSISVALVFLWAVYYFLYDWRIPCSEAEAKTTGNCVADFVKKIILMVPVAIRKIAICLYVLIVSSQGVVAQFKNIKLDEKVDGDFVCEPTIAINPRNVNTIVAASVLNNIYVTHDGGNSWNKQKLQSPLGVYGDPALIADPSGNFHFFHLSDPTLGKGGYESEKLDRIVAHTSSDGGETWSEGVSIGLNHPKDQDKPWPGIDSKGNLYVAWTQFDTYGDKNPDCKSVILLSESRNGKKWSEPIVISQVNGDCVDEDNTVMGAMPAAVDGKTFVAWAHKGQIFLDRSYDGSMWLSNDIRVVDQVGGWDLKISGHDRSNGLPVLLTNRGKGSTYGYLHMVWADQRNGADNTDVWFVRSGNFGDNWTTPVKVNLDNTKTHQYLPWMAIDQTNGFIYIVFYDRRDHDDLQTDVYLAWSVDGGASFKNVKISESSFAPDEKEFFGDYTNIAAHKGVITPIWTRMENGKTSIWTAVIKQADLDTLK